MLRRLSAITVDTFLLATAALGAPGPPMALVLFPAATVGLVMLPLMLFHQIQLMVCAVIASVLSRDGEPAQATSAPLGRPTRRGRLVPADVDRMGSQQRHR